jgi:hypothetical protein
MSPTKLILSCALFISAAPAYAKSLDQILTALEREEGDKYVQARRDLLALGPAVLSELEARQSAAKNDPKRWKRAAILEAARAWIEHPEEARKAYALAGLDARVYSKRRRPDPEASRELTDLAAGPILFELLFKTSSVYPFAREADHPAVLRAKEEQALASAVILALGRSNHPSSHLALVEVARSEARSIELRATAAYALGIRGTEEGERQLLALLAEKGLPAAVRHGVIQGLGGIRTPAAVLALRRVLHESRDRAERQIAIRSLGSAASPRLAKSDALRDEASAALCELLLRPEAADHGDALVETIALIRAPAARATLRAILDRKNLDPSTRRLAERAERRLP